MTYRPDSTIRAIVADERSRLSAAPLTGSSLDHWIIHLSQTPFAELPDDVFRDAIRNQTLAMSGRLPHWLWPRPEVEDGEAAPGDRAAVTQAMIDDMKAPPDGRLKGVKPTYGWAHRAYNYMGNRPRADNTPRWWRDAHGDRFPGWWKSAIPWMVLFEGVDNRTHAPELEVAWIRLYLRYGGRWQRVSEASTLGGFMQPQAGDYFGGSIRPQWHGRGSNRMLRLVQGLNFHGYGKVSPVDGPAIEAVHAKLRARLVGDAIDRAQWLIHVGADYYPGTASPPIILPAIAISRPKRVTGQWQDFTMTTFSDVAVQEPGGGIDEAAFRADPPLA